MNIFTFERLQTVDEFCEADPCFKKFVHHMMEFSKDSKHGVNTCPKTPMNKAFFRFGNLTLISERIFHEALDSYYKILNGEFEVVNVEANPQPLKAISR